MDPDQNDEIKRIEINDDLKAAAGEIVRHYGNLHDLPGNLLTTDVIGIFQFQTEELARRAELAICEILVRADGTIVSKIVEHFEMQTKSALAPVRRSLDDIKSRFPSNTETLSAIDVVNRSVEATKTRTNDFIFDINKHADNKAWDQVALVWVEMIRFIDGIREVRHWLAEIEATIILAPNGEKLHRPITPPVAFGQIGPVERRDAAIWIPIDAYIKAWPTSLCTTIADSANSEPIPVTRDVDIILTQFNLVLNQLGSLSVRFLGDENKYEEVPADIDVPMRGMIKAQGTFSKFMSPKMIEQSPSKPNDLSFPSINPSILVLRELIESLNQTVPKHANTIINAERLRVPP